MGAKTKSKDITIVRIYDAPVKMVWDAWNDVKQAAQWWGPRGFTITSHSKDLRPGGIWHYTMHGPDGKDWPNKTLYHVVEPYARLVYDHGGYDDKPPLFRVTATFADVGGKTKLEMTMSLPTVEAAEETRKFIKQAGGNGTWDRLGEFLAKKKDGKENFIINRSFDAPIETMFDMWTNPKHFVKWLAPTGFNMEFRRDDIKTGGSTFYSMSNGSGVTMYGRARYLEITKPNRIVYTQEFTDANEGPARHPMAPTWPAMMKTTVTLTPEGPDGTRVTVEWEVEGKCTADEMETFKIARGGMTQGWTGSFDKLEDYLSNL